MDDCSHNLLSGVSRLPVEWLIRDQRAAAVSIFLLSLHPSVPRVEEDDEAAGEQTEQSGLHQHRHYSPETARQKDGVSQVMLTAWKVLE